MNHATEPLKPCIYEGAVVHHRSAEARHAFRYEVFFAFLDIDRIPELCAESGVVGYNRFGAVTFDERDHLGDPSRSLRERLTRDAHEHGVTLPEGPIFLLTHLRHLGYCFNPASFFFCCDASGRPTTYCIEVRNHFRERCTYWLGEGTLSPFDAEGVARPPKHMHVSPFLPVTGRYAVTMGAPSERLKIRVDYHKPDGERAVGTALALERSPWSPASIQRAVAKRPQQSWQIAVQIYREAAALLLKGVTFFWHPEGKLPRLPLP